MEVDMLDEYLKMQIANANRDFWLWFGINSIMVVLLILSLLHFI